RFLLRLHLDDIEFLRTVEPKQCGFSFEDLHDQQPGLGINLLHRAIEEHFQQFIEAVQVERDDAPLRFVRDLRQRAIKRLLYLANSATKLLADASRRATRQPFLQDEIVSGVIGLRGITHRLPRFALRSRSAIVARNSRAISTCAISASRARARWGKPATLLTL